MCGIAGILSLKGSPVPFLEEKLNLMSKLIAHRGPDDNGIWADKDNIIGLAHRRLSIVDLSSKASQPMQAPNKTSIVFNGEIYNLNELKEIYRSSWAFKTKSDTECILAGYEIKKKECISDLRGMFSFAIWDNKKKSLFCARDRFGIKPFYYTIVDDVFYFASEVKSLVPFLKEIKTSEQALAEYLTFQYCIGEKTLFDGVYQLLPGHALVQAGKKMHKWKYWDISYNIDFDLGKEYSCTRLREKLDDSIKLHTRSDVAIGSYVSGGIDSSLIYLLSQNKNASSNLAFHGLFAEHPKFNESNYAEDVVKNAQGILETIDIKADDFITHFEKIIYHLDFPVAGPGAFPQYMVSMLASKFVKVVLGGQGGDEIFGGYARYLVAYFEQCIKAAIDGHYRNGNYVVTIESIIPNLTLLKEYKPLIKSFWSKGLFDNMDRRYFRLIDRSTDMQDEIDWRALDMEKVFEDFTEIFNNPTNVDKEAYFDKMTHFDFKCLLPALLHVEDRMSMAHGLESRVPMLDHPLVEFAATVPADIKFASGQMKYLIKETFKDVLPSRVLGRRDKMGFPVPLNDWFKSGLREFSLDILNSMASKNRPYINSKAILSNFGSEATFSRKLWALMSLEVWFQQFHDKSREWQSMVKR